MICDATGKRSHASRKAAKRACRKVGNRFRVYCCTHCGGWHITKRVGR
jgi:hypothetical protein